MGCLYSKNKFIENQIRDEYKKRKTHISTIGNYKPYQVFYGNENNLNDSYINGLNSMCNCDIHISLGSNPTRIIISYVDINTKMNITEYVKGQTFHIYKIMYKEINSIDNINQYDIYNAIQDYIYINGEIPKNDNYSVAI